MSAIEVFSKLLLGYVLLIRIEEAEGPVDKALVDKVNRMQNNWKAYQTPKAQMNLTLTTSFPIVSDCPVNSDDENEVLPNFFDAREAWPECQNVTTIPKNQEHCDASWATAPVSMLNDRLCIETSGQKQYHLSAEDVMVCCKTCRIGGGHPCGGGCPVEVIKYWQQTGIVNGGEYNSEKGCKPYTRYTGRVATDKCIDYCTKKNTYKRTGGFVCAVPNNEEKIMREIKTHGPVIASMVVYEDLIIYYKGVYNHSFGLKMGIQYVKLIGWGHAENMNYWLVVNSQGTKWGNEGSMMIKRGTNECDIEEDILTGRTKQKVSHRVEKIVKHEDAKMPQMSLVKYVLLELIIYLYLY